MFFVLDFCLIVHKMSFFHKKEAGEPEDTGMFAYTSKYITDELELSEAQVTKLNGVKEAIKAAREKVQENRKDKRAEMLALLDQRTLDQEKAMAMLTKRGEEMKAQAPKVIEALAGFYDSLSADQQQTLRETIKDRMERRDNCGPKRSRPDREKASFDMEERPSFQYEKPRYSHYSDRNHGITM